VTRIVYYDRSVQSFRKLARTRCQSETTLILVMLVITPPPRLTGNGPKGLYEEALTIFEFLPARFESLERDSGFDFDTRSCRNHRMEKRWLASIVPKVSNPCCCSAAKEDIAVSTQVAPVKTQQVCHFGACQGKNLSAKSEPRAQRYEPIHSREHELEKGASPLCHCCLKLCVRPLRTSGGKPVMRLTTSTEPRRWINWSSWSR